MLGYEWGNPTMIMPSGDENVQENDQNHQVFINPYYETGQTFSSNVSTSLVHHNNHLAHHYPYSHHHQPPESHHHFFHNPNGQEASNNTIHFPSLNDPRGFNSEHRRTCELDYRSEHQTSLLSFELAGPTAGYMMTPKTEPVVGGVDYSSGSTSNSRLGLNLGVRTYFFSNDDLVNRLYPRSKALEAGSVNSPKCQAQDCSIDLTHAKHYHRRHKVCEFHSKAATVVAAGLTQRFCQQCSRFHMLSEFDNGKRSCRRRLADHNRRRRKSHHHANQENAN